MAVLVRGRTFWSHQAKRSRPMAASTASAETAMISRLPPKMASQPARARCRSGTTGRGAPTGRAPPETGGRWDGGGGAGEGRAPRLGDSGRAGPDPVVKRRLDLATGGSVRRQWAVGNGEAPHDCPLPIAPLRSRLEDAGVADVLRGEGQQGQVAGALEGGAQGALVLGAGARLAARLDLAAVGDVAAQAGRFLVVDQGDLVHAELADLAPGDVAAATATARSPAAAARPAAGA